MRIQKVLVITIICLAIACPVLAQQVGIQGQPAGDQPQGQAPGGAPQGNSSNANLDFGPAYDAMDKDKDGKVAKEEWLASGMNQDSYNKLFTEMLDGNKDLIITKAEFTSSKPLFEVDTNKDGKVSLQEFVDANKKAVKSMGSGGQGDATAGAAPAAQQK